MLVASGFEIFRGSQSPDLLFFEGTTGPAETAVRWAAEMINFVSGYFSNVTERSQAIGLAHGGSLRKRILSRIVREDQNLSGFGRLDHLAFCLVFTLLIKSVIAVSTSAGVIARSCTSLSSRR